MGIAAQQKTIMSGYKQTEVGVIPEDWNAEPLGPHVEIKSGESPSLFRFENDGTPYFKVEQLNNNSKYLEDTPYFFKGDKSVRCGSLIFPKRGASILLNKVRILKQASFMDTNLMTLTPRGNTLDSEFLYYALTYIQLWRIADTTSIPQINNKHINPLVVAFPSEPEQQTIAAALSDVDELIGTLDKLIAKKRDLKQATMQQLLTGKIRLPGFGGSWELKSFGAITTPRKNRVDPRRSGVQEFCLELEHIDQGTGKLLGSTIAGTQSSLKSVFQPGDVLFGKLRAYLRKYWLANRSGVCSTEIWVLVPDTGVVTPEFLFHIVQADRFIEVASFAYGTHMPRSDWSVVKNYELPIPKPDEQAAIATVLSDMDAEIAALEQRRDKTRALKQGMMQKLLTGKTRLT